jgi:hypothetical protein
VLLISLSWPAQFHAEKYLTALGVGRGKVTTRWCRENVERTQSARALINSKYGLTTHDREIEIENEPNCQRTLLTQRHRRLGSSGLGNGRSRSARREGRLLAGSGWVGLRGLRGAGRRNQDCFNFHGSNERAVAASLARPLATGHLFQFPWDHETAVAARSARVSRPRRSADRTSPGHAPTIGDWETCPRQFQGLFFWFFAGMPAAYFRNTIGDHLDTIQVVRSAAAQSHCTFGDCVPLRADL